MTDVRPQATAGARRKAAAYGSGLPTTGTGAGVARLAPAGFLAAVAVAVTVRDPHVAGSWGVCPTYALFGVYCPGCGSLRGMHDLVGGDVRAAFGHNALLIPAVVFVLWATVRTPGPRWGRIWLVAVVAFTLVRNLPGSPLAP